MPCFQYAFHEKVHRSRAERWGYYPQPTAASGTYVTLDKKAPTFGNKVTFNNKSSSGIGYQVPIGVSARHIHLTQADVETLFGKGNQTSYYSRRLM